MNTDQRPYEEEKLLHLLVGGNEYAFQMIYNRHHQRIYKVAMKYLKSPVIAQEVVQEVFLKLWLKRELINPDMPVEAWLVTVAKNNTLDRVKKLANEWKALDYLKNTFEYEDTSLQEKIKEEEYVNIINRAVATLSEMQCRVYKLAKEENLSYLQIAEHLNISPLTVKTHMSRALGNIKSFVKLNWNFISLLFFCFWTKW